MPLRPPSRKSADVALALVIGALCLAPACKKTREASEPPAEPAARPDPAPATTVAEVDENGEITISPAQDAAGIPYVRFRVELGDAPSRGPADAPVTIVMFSDFECPYCMVGSETVKQLEAEYPEQIRFVYKAFPIDRHPNALVAALVAHSAQEQGKFWPFFDLLYSQRGIDPDIIEGYANEVGLDMTKVAEDLDSLRHAPAVKRDIREAQRFEITSTPTFFINGRYIRGAQPIEAFRMLIEQEMALAKEWSGEGVDKAKVYDHATQYGYTEIVYKNAREKLDDSMVFPVPLGDSPQLGPKDAPITIVIFGDFQCPFCVRGFETMEQLRKRYGSQLRLVYKHFPLPGHSYAIHAARASHAAHEQGKFWEFHDEVYRRGARFGIEDLELIAMRLGLNMEQFVPKMESQQYDERIKADMELGVALGVSGTPTFFVNGRPVDGARSEFEFRMLIAEEMERVEKKRAEGVAPEKIYDALTGQ